MRLSPPSALGLVVRSRRISTAVVVVGATAVVLLAGSGSAAPTIDARLATGAGTPSAFPSTPDVGPRAPGVTRLHGRAASASSLPASSISYAYDDAGRLSAVIDPNAATNGVAKYAYDSVGNITSIARSSSSGVQV